MEHHHMPAQHLQQFTILLYGRTRLDMHGHAYELHYLIKKERKGKGKERPSHCSKRWRTSLMALNTASPPVAWSSISSPR